MENEQKPLVEATTTPAEQTENVAKTYTQAEVDELTKNLFTQEQVNKMIQDRVSREKKLVKVDQSENTENSQVTEPKENDDELNRVKGELLSTQTKLAEYEKKVALSKYQIEDEFVDYVNFKVSQSVNNETDYETALKNFMEADGKKYIVKPQVQSTPRPTNSGTQLTEMQQYVLDKYNKKISV